MADRSMIHLFIASCYTPWLLLRDNGPFAEDICKAVNFFFTFSKPKKIFRFGSSQFSAF